MLSYLLFPFFWLGASAVRVGLKVFGPQERIDTAQISNYRDEADIRLFGFWSIKNAPRVLSWTRSSWEGLESRLFMISVTTDQVKKALENEEKAPREFLRIKELFREAVDKAVGLGAKNVLLAATTKRLFKPGELEKLYHGVIFTLGDNFTGLLLIEKIKQAVGLFGNPKNVRVLIIAPYGFLGKVALYAVCAMGCQVVGMGNPGRPDVLLSLAKKFNFTPVFNFEEVGKVDLVVACSEARPVQLNKKIIDGDKELKKPGIRFWGKTLLVIDPCEPSNFTPVAFKECDSKSVIRFDAGNGYSSKLKYVLGWVSYRILRLTRGETWGCFCENFLIAKYPELQSENWFSVTPERIQKLYKFYGSGTGQFCLPKPTCHGKPITDFSLEYVEKTEKQEESESFPEPIPNTIRSIPL